MYSALAASIDDIGIVCNNGPSDFGNFTLLCDISSLKISQKCHQIFKNFFQKSFVLFRNFHKFLFLYISHYTVATFIELFIYYGFTAQVLKICRFKDVALGMFDKGL